MNFKKKTNLFFFLIIIIFCIAFYIIKDVYDDKQYYKHIIDITSEDIYDKTNSPKDLLRYGKSEIYLNKKSFENGICFINEAIRREPNNPDFYIEAASVCIYVGEKEKAVNYLVSAEKVLDKEKNIHNKSYRYFNIAQRYNKLKMYEDSLRNYKKCLQNQPDDKIYNKDGTYVIDKGYRQNIINHIQKIEKYLQNRGNNNKKF
ncbi:MAG: hypothetical protein QXJ06_05480 [Candidatus Aenigmatarchaeota archaeon]